MSLSRSETAYTAVHEAGHAVLYRACDFKVRRVVIVDRLLARNGYVWHGYILLYRPQDAALKICLAAALAGVIAENLVFGTRPRPLGADLADIDKHLRGYSAADRKRMKRSASRLCRKVLRGNMPALKRVARYLMAHKRINGTARLDRVLSGAKL